MTQQPRLPEKTESRATGAYPAYQIAAAFIVGWLFVLIGLVGLVCTPISAWRALEFVRHAVHAKAPIVAFRTYPPGRRETHDTYRPIVEITGSGAAPVRALVGAAAYPNPFHTGDVIDVLYPPQHPAEAVRATTEDTFGATIALIVISPVALLLGAVCVLWMRYFVRHPPDKLAWIDKWFVPLKLITWL